MLKWKKRGAPTIICRIKNSYLKPKPLSLILYLPFHCETWLLYLSHQHRVMINMFSLIPHLPHIFLLYLILSYLILLYLIIAKPGLSVASRSGISPLLTCSRAGRPSQKGLRLQMIRKLYLNI